ncbi:DUF4179 domain-containing protein [Paenibacillus doosanensis]|uniref:DUF4179 domain-containing protein n=1 Tax=Paenibacillus doosanensis TaxID=1229154 RepID=UPI00217F5852|nr:DUF4179 domain-containing protein [Paenibacillus doosanensis]MCS7463282.1 DUF4179 domain-containing protein [Paenibacillus doosanensis]
MKREREKDLAEGLEQALQDIPVPESLFQFAEALPDTWDRGEPDGERTGRKKRPAHVERRRLPVLFRGSAAAAVLAVSLTAGMTMSPAFAALVKGIPGIAVTVDWLQHIREQDGVQTAINHDYIPIEPVTATFGGTVITIGDIYLTEEELLFKSFIQTDLFDVTDGRSSEHLSISPLESLPGGGSTTASSVITAADGSGKPVLQETYKYQLSEGAVQQFLAKGTELELDVTQSTFNEEKRQTDIREIGRIKVPIQSDKLLHNKVLEPKLALPVGDPDLKELSLEKLTIQPTTMNLILKGPEGWYYDFPRDNAVAPYLKDDQGHEYRYDPSGPGLLYYEEGRLQLPFSSSVYFEPDVRTLTLHIGELTVGEGEPSEKLELSMNDEFPRTVQFKKQEIVIEGADYAPQGYLHLKIKKDSPGQTKLEGVFFGIAEKENLKERFDKEGPEAYEAYTRKQVEDREAFNVSGFGIAEDYRGQDYLDVYIPARQLDRYTLTLSRARDTIAVNRDYTVSLKP